MKLIAKNILSLTFWKRSPDSIEAIDKLTITKSDKSFLMTIKENKERKLSINEVDALLTLIQKECDIDNTSEEYKAFKYENDKDNFSLKFYLEINFIDFTYLAIKGVQPFKQPHYKEIIALFNALLQD